MGEFGRTVRNGSTPGLNNTQGRDHYFQHFTFFAGGGISGGGVMGSTTADGFAVLDPGWSQNRPVATKISRQPSIPLWESITPPNGSMIRSAVASNMSLSLQKAPGIRCSNSLPEI
ncbi:MAG: DUF1501 domain-containing protein [Acidobacteria bacterium]|nr:DUF1501 domain-containing protein [Acidobacteriota bacterium]